MGHDIVILCILKKEDDLFFVCYFHIIYLYKQTITLTKYLVPLLITYNNQEKYIYVPKSIGYFSPLMLPLAVCQLGTSLSEYWIVNGCWNTGEAWSVWRKKNRKYYKSQIFLDCFLRSSLIFSKMVHWNVCCYFALQSVHQDASFKLSSVAIGGFSVFTFVRDTLTSAVFEEEKNAHMPKIA